MNLGMVTYVIHNWLWILRLLCEKGIDVLFKVLENRIIICHLCYIKYEANLWNSWSWCCKLLRSTSLGIGFVVLLFVCVCGCNVLWMMESKVPWIKIKKSSYINFFFPYNYFWVFSGDGIYVGWNNFSSHGVGRMLVTWNLIFLMLKPKNFFVVFSFSRRELGSKIRLDVKIGKMMKASRGFKTGQVAEQVMG